VGAAASWIASADPRPVSLLALAVVVAAAGSMPQGVGAALGLLLPVAFGALFGAATGWTIGALALAAFLAREGLPRAAAVVFGLAAALDWRVLAAAPLLSLSREWTGGLAASRRLGLVAAGFAAGVAPIVLLDPSAFASALGRVSEIGPGVGLGNLLSYHGAPPPGALRLLQAASSAVAVFGLLLAGRVTPARALQVAALVTLAALWLDPAPPAVAVAVPLVLLVLSAADAAPGHRDA
jgi:hypothetical protein